MTANETTPTPADYESMAYIERFRLARGNTPGQAALIIARPGFLRHQPFPEKESALSTFDVTPSDSDSAVITAARAHLVAELRRGAAILALDYLQHLRAHPDILRHLDDNYNNAIHDRDLTQLSATHRAIDEHLLDGIDVSQLLPDPRHVTR